MKKNSTCLVVMCSMAILAPGLLALAGEVQSRGGDWWDIPYPEPFDASKIETTLQLWVGWGSWAMGLASIFLRGGKLSLRWGGVVSRSLSFARP